MIEFIKEIARNAGDLSLNEFEHLSTEDIEFKNEKDIVTSADRKVEEYLRNEIEKKFPEHDFYGEESGRTESGSEFCWVIDPIDGTTSFVHGQPFFSVSIALQKNGETVACAVNAPRLGELYHAEKGRGAFLNEKQIRVSARDKLVNSVFSTGFACIRAGWQDNNMRYFEKIVPCLRGIRRYGSAAIDLAYVASGRLEAFWEMNLKLYDIAAGILLVTEAGGKIYDFHGGNEFPEKGTVAGNGLMDDEILKFFI